MSLTMEEKNAMLRHAVETRRENQAAGKPHEEWYGERVAETPAVRHEAEDLLQPATLTETYAEWEPPTYARQTGDGVMGERPIGSVEWLEAVEQLRELHFEKTAQYGDTDPFANVTASAKCGVEPWRRALCDLSDCVVRMQRYANGQPVDYENALMDAANWALICLVKLREAKA